MISGCGERNPSLGGSYQEGAACAQPRQPPLCHRLGGKRGSRSAPHPTLPIHRTAHAEQGPGARTRCEPALTRGMHLASTSAEAGAARVRVWQKPAHGQKGALLGKGREGCAEVNHSLVAFALVSGPVAKAEGPIGPLVVLLFLLPAASVSLSQLLDTKQLSR